jgi:hypothetical protein
MWRFVEEAEDLDPLWRFRFTKASTGHCSAPMCESTVDILLTLPHKRSGTWTRGLCRDHALRYRRRGPGAHS